VAIQVGTAEGDVILVVLEVLERLGAGAGIAHGLVQAADGRGVIEEEAEMDPDGKVKGSSAG
jgi:hypothetical protein